VAQEVDHLLARMKEALEFKPQCHQKKKKKKKRNLI
jgi:hypothetical protein